ncbi:hypothetical protein [Thiomicrorhabdus arctica]|uniref:hypothetical protein n=1 Tax=Thiomicrorhabdus arctica TaxID=131540 RepID=UPI00037BCF87|nr:hypothetical protein [Thiomicrorhabdus arctica]
MKFHFKSVSKSAVSALIFSMGMAVSASVLAGPQATPGANSMPHGQPSQQLSPEKQAIVSELESLQKELQATQHSLQGVQQQAFKKNPSFIKQREKLQALVFKKMSTKDYDATKEVRELQSIATKYQKGKTKPTQEEVLKFRQRDQAFQQRQQKAMQDPEVQKMTMSLKNNVEKAMMAINPKTKELVAQMESKSKKFMQLRQKMASM